MKLAYATTYNARSLQGSNEWSGTGYHIAEALKNQALYLEYVGPLKTPIALKAIHKLKRHYYEQFHGRNYQKDPDPLMLKNYASQINKKLNEIEVDIIFSATVDPIAYLDYARPIVFWADGTFAKIQNFYPQYSNLCESVIHDWHKMESLALQKCSLAIYSSEWAAKSAVDDYGADPTKIKVVPFGSNTDSPYSYDTIQDVIRSRDSNRCKLLFLAVDWVRKGGDTAYRVAKELNRIGLKTELTVVGCQPLIDEPLPDFVKVLGFVSKSSSEGKERIQNLILDSHFLILPTLADCTPIVLCEANSLAVPCLSTTVGGIPTMVRNDINGRLFSSESDVSEYCSYIHQLFLNYSNYQDLALSAFNEYQLRLNWAVAGQTVKDLLFDLVL